MGRIGFSAALCGVLGATLIAPVAVAAPPPSYTIVDLGAPTGYSIGYGINEAGVVVGHLETPTFSVEAARWDAGLPAFLDSLGAGGTLARAVNESGVAAGEAYDGLGGVHAVVWTGTAVTDLGVLAGNYSTAFGINDLGEVAGEGQSATPFNHAIKWDGTSWIDLGVLSGGDSSHGRGINNAGQVVGDSEIEPGGNAHAVIWTGTTPLDLGTLPGDTYSNGVAINQAGHAVGRSLGRPGGGQFGFFWDGTSLTEIPMLDGGTFVEVGGMNDLDQVVGRADQFGGAYQTAFLWEASTGQMTDLQTLLPSGSGWALHQAFAINNAGQITGYGVHDGVLRAFLMTPAATPAPTDTVVEDVPAGGTITTDVGAPGATPEDPITTTIEAPIGGAVVIREGIGLGIPGFTIVGQPITIQALASEPENPYRITFVFDASVIPAGEDETTIDILRDGELAGECPGATVAVPDPCVATRVLLGDGDVAITVLSSHASVWLGVISTGPSFDFTGFFAPVDSAPVVNVVKPGSAVPVRFSLGGDFGLEIFAAQSPASRSIACDGSASTDPLEQTANAATSGLQYNAVTGVYTYVWKTDKAWTGCRELVLDFADGSSVHALFKLRK